MKKLFFLLVIASFYGSVDAGLFEYTLGESTHINANPTTTVDTIESLSFDTFDLNTNGSSFNTHNSFNTNTVNNGRFNKTTINTNSRNINSFNTNSSNNFFDVNSRNNPIEFYIEELEKLEMEEYFIDDIRRQIQITIRDLGNTNTRFYYDLIESLEEIQEREEFIENLIYDYRSIVSKGFSRNNDLIDNLTNLGVANLSFSFNRKSNFERFNSGRFSNPRFSSESFRRGSSFFDTDYRYYDDIYNNNFSSYSQSRRFGRSPSWVNPFLSDNGEGYVYIR